MIMSTFEEYSFMIESLLRRLEPSQNPSMERPDDSEIIDVLKHIINNMADLTPETEIQDRADDVYDDVEYACNSLRMIDYDDEDNVYDNVQTAIDSLEEAMFKLTHII